MILLKITIKKTPAILLYCLLLILPLLYKLKGQNMKTIKQILQFILGGVILTAIALFVTQIFFYKTDLTQYGLGQLLFFDYIISYLLYPLLYRPKFKKIIPNKYMFYIVLYIPFFVFFSVLIFL